MPHRVPFCSAPLPQSPLYPFFFSHAQLHRRASADGPQALAEATFTPALDALAADGVRLTRHYAFKICAPSRAALHTGRLPTHVSDSNVAPTAVGLKCTSTAILLCPLIAKVGTGLFMYSHYVRDLVSA